MARQRPYRREQILTALICALIVLLYFLIPVEPGEAGTRLVVRATATVIGVIVVAGLVLVQVRQQLSGPTGTQRSLTQLAVALVAGVMIFALADFVIAVSGPEQFSGIRTKIDALYFALATLTTIGYGDVHASGQLARGAVILQMLFSIGVLATGGSLLLRNWAQRSTARSAQRNNAGGGPPTPGTDDRA